MPSLRKLAAMLCVVCLLAACMIPASGQVGMLDPLTGGPPSGSSALVQADIPDSTQNSTPGFAVSGLPVPDSSPGTVPAIGESSSAPAPGGGTSPRGGTSAPDGTLVSPMAAGQAATSTRRYPWGYPTSAGTQPNTLFVDEYGFFHVGNYDPATYKPYPLPNSGPDSDGHICVWVPRSWHSEPEGFGFGQHIYDCASGSACVHGWFTGVQLEPPWHTHDFSVWKTLKEPTDTTSGLRRQLCSICGAHGVEELIPPLKHVAGEPVPPLPACEHAFGNWKTFVHGYKTYRQRDCSLCRHSELEVVSVYTPSEPKTCTQHSYGDWVTAYDPTETAAGSKHRKCQACGNTEYASIPKLPHTQHTGIWQTAVQATYHAAGHKERRCTVCGLLETETLPQLVCAPHSMNEWITPPTESAPGLIVRQCQNCSLYEEQEIPPLAPAQEG